METLIREKYSPKPIPDALSEALIQEAAEVLGYKPLYNEQTLAEKRVDLLSTRKNQLKLAEALAKLEIEPLREESVLRYQQGMIDKQRARSSWSFTRWMHGPHGEDVVTGTALIGGVGSFALVLVNFLEHFLPTVDTYGAGYWALFGVLLCFRHKQAYDFNAGWDKISLNEYTNPIPTFALNRAVELKRELPEVKFHVEEFTVVKNEIAVRHKPVLAAYDPFMVASYQGIKVHLDVWNEAEFEGRKTI